MKLSLINRFVSEAPVIIVVCAEDKTNKWALIDCAIASQNIMLEAHSLGLGSCFVGVFDENKIKDANGCILLKKLDLWHLNDSKNEFNSGKDRHENIGQGKIGLNEFKILLNHPLTKNYPFIIETPGFNNEGPDKKNLDILKSLIVY